MLLLRTRYSLILSSELLVWWNFTIVRSLWDAELQLFKLRARLSPRTASSSFHPIAFVRCTLRAKSVLSIMDHLRPFPILLFLIVTSAIYNCCSAVLLDESSVVLITGAAGFIGSEVALALHQLYSPKKLILVDNLQFDDLGSLEFKRQRVFRLLQNVENVFFYRADFRASIPEYFDTSEVPVLNGIFTHHSDITHVLHLADANKPGGPVIPRTKGDERAGMMETLLEQMILQANVTGHAPFFVYASSGEVYSHATRNTGNPNPPPFRENLPLTTPSTTVGASKLLHEISAQAYYDNYKVQSLGLRFFSVYGPWDNPSSRIFGIAEQIVGGKTLENLGNTADQHDFVYIDDAVDAILAALQLDVSQAVAINVGTGKGVSTFEVVSLLSEIAGFGSNLSDPTQEPEIVSYADTTRLKEVLGWEPQVRLEDGLRKVLAWHSDRAFPYKNTGQTTSYDNTCDAHDAECWNGTPVFPCASECANPSRCKGSLYDDVLPFTRGITSQCETVLYTVDLKMNASHIPSAFIRVSTQSKAYVTPQICNIAFVAVDSPLYRDATVGSDTIRRHGFWTLVPVKITQFAYENVDFYHLLPKLSPGLFFADSVRKAIYTDPDILIDDVGALLQEADLAPSHPSVSGSTLLLVGHEVPDLIGMQRPVKPSSVPKSKNAQAQERAYRMIRIAVIDQLQLLTRSLDTSFLLHRLDSRARDDDGRLFRCDVFTEVMQWNVPNDHGSLDFILGLHDIWSRLMVEKSGLDPWWTGESVETRQSAGHRRLEEVVSKDEDDVASTPQRAQHEEHNGFGVVDAIEAVFGFSKQQERFERPHQPTDEDDFVVVDDDEEKPKDKPYQPLKQQAQLNDDDVWLGILSSTSTRYFCHIVSLESVGLYRVTNELEKEVYSSSL